MCWSYGFIRSSFVFLLTSFDTEAVLCLWDGNKPCDSINSLILSPWKQMREVFEPLGLIQLKQHELQYYFITLLKWCKYLYPIIVIIKALRLFFIIILTILHSFLKSITFGKKWTVQCLYRWPVCDQVINLVWFMNSIQEKNYDFHCITTVH